jgi:hypothetical protein
MSDDFGGYGRSSGRTRMANQIARRKPLFRFIQKGNRELEVGAKEGKERPKPKEQPSDHKDASDETTSDVGLLSPVYGKPQASRGLAAQTLKLQEWVRDEEARE